jgi:hypothetical protein
MDSPLKTEIIDAIKNIEDRNMELELSLVEPSKFSTLNIFSVLRDLRIAVDVPNDHSQVLRAEKLQAKINNVPKGEQRIPGASEIYAVHESNGQQPRQYFSVENRPSVIISLTGDATNKKEDGEEVPFFGKPLTQSRSVCFRYFLLFF